MSHIDLICFSAIPEDEQKPDELVDEAGRSDQLAIEDESMKHAKKKDNDDLGAKQLAAMEAVEKLAATKSTKDTGSPVAGIDFGAYTKKVVSFLARNFFTMKFIALAIAFTINFMLLFYKVSVIEQVGEEEDIGPLDEAVDAGSGDEEAEDPADEYVHVDEKFYYLEYIIRVLGVTHAIVSFCMLIAYYNLKVPLAIFKREKEVARRLEFDGLYLAEQPEDDDIKAYWDKLVISAK